MELTIIGCSSAAPNPGAACSGYTLDAGQGVLLLECGHGVAGKLQLYTELDRLAAILISHMHPDHFFDLVGLMYARLRDHLDPLPLYLPPRGVEIVKNIASILGEGEDFWAKAYDLRTFDPDSGLDVAGMHVEMAPTHHFIPAWAMRFATAAAPTVYLAYTSDTSTSSGVIELVQGARLLLAEASIKQQRRLPQKRGHMTPEETGALAREAGVGRLVITHYVAARAADILRSATDAFRGEVELATEGARFVVGA